MEKKKAEKEIASLRAEIQKHNRLYHTLDRPEISDYDYDQLFDRLLSLEAQYPEFKDDQSPTQKVGGEVLASFEKMAHQEPMLSLQNTYSPDEIIEFEKKIQKQLHDDSPVEFYCSPKYDGVAIELVYEAGQLTRAITRGDGVVGENVISNVRTMQEVPKSLDKAPDRLDVRGEILLFKQDFANINQRQQERGESPFANPRNAAAGTLRQLDSNVAKERRLKMFCYSLGHSEGVDFQSQLDFEKALDQLGLPVMPKAEQTLSKNELSKVCFGAQEVIDYYNKVGQLREDLDFEIDGIVIKVNSYPLQRSLGNIARSPRWAFAAKFTPDQVETTIKNIVVQVGRTGALTPVAVMEPVEVGGVTVTFATLHNQDEINRKDVRIGDKVIIHRAGDVIPEVVKVLINKRPKGTKPFAIPDLCPVCNQPTEQLDGEVVKRCINPLCEAIMVESLKHFVSRNALNIDKLGARLVEVFFKAGLVKNFSDIYKLTREQILNLDRQGEKSTDNLLDSIEKSKETELHRLIYGLGIRFVGAQTARALANHFRSVEAFLMADAASLEAIPDVGPKVAESITLSLSNDSFKKELRELIKVGVTPRAILVSAVGQSAPLKGMSFVVTGTLPVPRNEAQDYIRQAGGQVTSTVSKKTSVLVAGDKAGSKLEKAEKLGVEVWSWDDLQKKALTE